MLVSKSRGVPFELCSKYCQLAPAVVVQKYSFGWSERLLLGKRPAQIALHQMHLRYG
jgi:hypothetical protein